MSRPEYQAPPELTYRAIELLNLPENEPAFLLDIGCGSGLSGEILDEEGHFWVGIDIAPSMLQIALEREVEGDLFLQDAGHGLGFRPGTFDGAISISVLQWLCNADRKSNNPVTRLNRFFTTLYSSLRRGARAIFQFYPENDDQCELIMNVAMKCGFQGGLVVDYPNSKKAKKFFLCLFAGINSTESKPQMPKALGVGENEEDEPRTVNYSSER
ncbi:3929_t:CDS:2 [Diversispora eburnea]|uniref:3929_t:CDS:1 n=1 Tax=Diversispora eburnea TaxID=1213867 RepID=A0A9N9ABA6_9GLOM|nr:3929_t:CDS:2 [Diversispora eburnea]